MKITVGENGTIVLEELFNPIEITSEAGPTISIAHRDDGIEFWYQGSMYMIKDGEVTRLKLSKIEYEEIETSNGN